MSPFIHSYCPTCGGQIVTGSDGTIWESFCCCGQREVEYEPEPEPEEEAQKEPKK